MSYYYDVFLVDMLLVVVHSLDKCLLACLHVGLLAWMLACLDGGLVSWLIGLMNLQEHELGRSATTPAAIQQARMTAVVGSAGAASKTNLVGYFASGSQRLIIVNDAS